MKPNEIVKQFKKLESKFKISCKKEIPPDSLANANGCVRGVLGRIRDTDWQQAFRDDIGPYNMLTAYGEVAGYCTHFIRRCQEYVQHRQSTDWTKNAQSQLVRDLSFAYATYWHLNDGHAVGLAMDNEIALLALETFMHFNPRPSIPRSSAFDDQAMRLIQEISALYHDYYCTPIYPKKGQKPLRDKKPAFKPWLIAEKSSSGQWSLPPVPDWQFHLLVNDSKQLILSDELQILLSFENARCQTSSSGQEELGNGQIQVRLWGFPIHQSELSVPLTADFENEALAVDYWRPGRRKWVLDFADTSPNDFRISAVMLEQLDEMILAAQKNILAHWGSSNSLLVPAVIDRCCIQRLERILKENRPLRCIAGFAEQLPSRFRSKAVCIAYLEAVPLRFESFIPEELKGDWDVAHAFLAQSMRDVPDNMPDHREFLAHHYWSKLPAKAQKEDFARYCIEKSGTGAFGWLPATLRTDDVRRFTVLTYPECLDSLNPVFTDAAERDAFLENTWTGILEKMNLARDLAAAGSCATAFEMAMRDRTLGHIAPQALPFFD